MNERSKIITKPHANSIGPLKTGKNRRSSTSKHPFPPPGTPICTPLLPARPQKKIAQGKNYPCFPKTKNP
jgi:hypothetical protein